MKQRSPDLSNLILRCLKDRSLLEQLKKDPKKVIEKECNLKLPEGFTLEILEETPQKGYIVIPFMDTDKEYSDEELQAIAGGAGAQRTSRQDGNCNTASRYCPIIIV